MNEENLSDSKRISGGQDEKPRHRRIVERFVITGRLQLETPAHFGNGDTDSLTDMPLLLDEVDQSPLLTGASLAGALRNYMRERELGYPPGSSPGTRGGQAEVGLFGGVRGDDEGTQSPLIVHDALGVAADIERRDGVRIDPKTRTAEDDKKFDFELLAAGSTFDLRFELLISLPPNKEVSSGAHQIQRARLLEALATALDGLANGEITLGARKRRGFGRCSVSEWTAHRYDLTTRAGLIAWLAEERKTAGAHWDESVKPMTNKSFAAALGEVVTLLPDNRKRFRLQAEFTIDGSLLVRSGSPDSGPDLVHLHSSRSGRKPVPIVAGTSWAGVLRSRAAQIAYTLGPATSRKRADQLINGIFGPAEIKSWRQKGNVKAPVKASRLEVKESEIKEGRLLEQTRVKIDRFTGGAFESALFSEQPLFGNDATRLALDLSLRLPAAENDEARQQQEKAEIGLLLLLLKDLWTGDLPLGGEVGSGRGRLRGIKAEINLHGQLWFLTQNTAGQLEIMGDRDVLQSFVAALKEELHNV